MTCPNCVALRALIEEQQSRIVFYEGRLRDVDWARADAQREADEMRAVHRRTRERLAVLIGRVGVALDRLDAGREREADHG